MTPIIALIIFLAILFGIVIGGYLKGRRVREEKLERERKAFKKLELLQKCVQWHLAKEKEIVSRSKIWIDKEDGQNEIEVTLVNEEGDTTIEYKFIKQHGNPCKGTTTAKMTVEDLLTFYKAKPTSNLVQSDQPVDQDQQTDSSGSTQESCSEGETKS